MPQIPSQAKTLLDLIASVESGANGYDVIYGHHERTLKAPITSLTLTQLLTAQAIWGREWGSSAAGRYQIMPATLQGLMASQKLTGKELFSPALQDQLGYALLVRRGYEAFMNHSLTVPQFGKQLAEEWASFPVLADTQGAHREVTRGQSYYAGDGLNKALLAPERVESTLNQMLG